MHNKIISVISIDDGANKMSENLHFKKWGKFHFGPQFWVNSTIISTNRLGTIFPPPIYFHFF